METLSRHQYKCNKCGYRIFMFLWIDGVLCCECGDGIFLKVEIGYQITEIPYPNHEDSIGE